MQIRGGGYPITSRLVKRDPRADSWSNKQYDASHEVAYQGDSPTDFVLEPYSDAELSNPPSGGGD